MGIALALAAMLGFASNILLTRYALARMPLEAGFFVVLATNILFPAALFALEFAARDAPWGWSWRGAGLFALAVLVVHTTPLAIFPVSVFVLKNREELSARTVMGAALVLAGIALLALR